MKVGDIIRLRTSGFGYHVWRVVGEYLGGMGQESVVEIETLDRTRAGSGKRRSCQRNRSRRSR